MYFKNLSLKKYELKNRDNIKGTLNGKKKHIGKQRWWWELQLYSSIPGIDAKIRLRLLFILSLTPGDFSLGSPVFPSPQKPSLHLNSNARLGVH